MSTLTKAIALGGFGQVSVNGIIVAFIIYKVEPAARGANMKNMSTQITTYIEDPQFKMARKFLSDETFAEAIESFIIVCTDVFFIQRTNGGVFLLAPRKAKPMQGFWSVGGRISAGELERDAITRIVKREAGLTVAPDRFEFVRMHRSLWANREQEPQNKGRDDITYIFVLDISDEEKRIVSAHLDPREYDTTKGLEEFDKERLERESVHKAVRDVYAVVFDEKS